jgi:hypothetical protein
MLGLVAGFGGMPTLSESPWHTHSSVSSVASPPFLTVVVAPYIHDSIPGCVAAGQKMQDIKRIDVLSSENGEMREKISDTEVTIKKLSEEIEERDAVISSNYHTIQLLRRRLQDLEKHKFVLAYKVRKLHWLAAVAVVACSKAIATL